MFRRKDLTLAGKQALETRVMWKGIQMSTKELVGVIKATEAYSKKMVLRLLETSQKTWDKMLDDGLPFTEVGHTRWVTGQALIEYFIRKAKRKVKAQ